MSYVYIQTEPSLWTVGHYGPEGDRTGMGKGRNFHPESDHSSPEDAAKRVAYLNGTGPAPAAHTRPRPVNSAGLPAPDLNASIVMAGVLCHFAAYDEETLDRFARWIEHHPGDISRDVAVWYLGLVHDHLAPTCPDPVTADPRGYDRPEERPLTPAQIEAGWSTWDSPSGVTHIIPPPGGGPCATCGRGRHTHEEE